MQVTQPHFRKSFEFTGNAGNILKEFERFIDRHTKNIGDAGSVIPDLQSLGIIPGAPALLTRDIYIREKVHLQFQLPIPCADFATATLHIETITPGAIPSHFRSRQLRKKLPDIRKGSCVRSRVTPWSATNRGLINHNNLIDVIETRDFRMLADRFR